MQGLSEIIPVVIGTQSGLCHLFMLTQGKPCKGMWHYPECWMYCTHWLVSIFMGKYHLTKFDAYFGLDIISSLRTHPTLRLVVTGRSWLCILCFVFIMVMTWTSSVTPASLEQYITQPFAPNRGFVSRDSLCISISCLPDLCTCRWFEVTW